MSLALRARLGQLGTRRGAWVSHGLMDTRSERLGPAAHLCALAPSRLLADAPLPTLYILLWEGCLLKSTPT